MLKKINKFIQDQNKTIYGPKGMMLIDPAERGLRTVSFHMFRFTSYLIHEGVDWRGNVSHPSVSHLPKLFFAPTTSSTSSHPLVSQLSSPRLPDPTPSYPSSRFSFPPPHTLYLDSKVLNYRYFPRLRFEDHLRFCNIWITNTFLGQSVIYIINLTLFKVTHISCRNTF